MADMTANISINTQSSIRIEGSSIIYIDPYKINTTSHDADMIFITHSHYDHLDAASIKAVEKESTIFIGPESITKDITGISGDHKFIPVTPESSYAISDIRVSTVPAYNKIKPFHPKRSKWVGYIIHMDGTSYYIAGDTDALPELKNISCDVALVPIGGKFTMNAKDAADFVNSIRPKYVIPTHYGSIIGSPEDAETLKKYLDKDIEIDVKLQF